jgi:hypothetical protein
MPDQPQFLMGNAELYLTTTRRKRRVLKATTSARVSVSIAAGTHRGGILNTVNVLTVLSFGNLCAGGALAWAACRLPPHAAILERCGGALLVAGLGLLGAALRSAAMLG